MESPLGLMTTGVRLGTCLVSSTSPEAVSFHAQFQLHPNRADDPFHHQQMAPSWCLHFPIVFAYGQVGREGEVPRTMERK